MSRLGLTLMALSMGMFALGCVADDQPNEPNSPKEQSPSNTSPDANEETTDTSATSSETTDTTEVVAENSAEKSAQPKSDSTKDEPPLPAMSEVPAIDVKASAAEISKLNREDEAKAKEAYEGKVVSINGEISDIQVNMYGNKMIYFKVEDSPVLAILTKHESERALYLRKGDEVTIVAKTNEFGYSINFVDGVITSALDDGRARAEPRMDGDVFERPDMGLRIPLPKGWNHNIRFPSGLVQSSEMYKGDMKDWRMQGVITVTTFDFEGRTIAEHGKLMEENSKFAKENFELKKSEATKVAGRDAWTMSYTHGHPNMPAFEQAWAIKKGDTFIIFVGMCAKQDEEAKQPIFQKSIDGLTWGEGD